jgi:hypothetical protein
VIPTALPAHFLHRASVSDFARQQKATPKRLLTKSEGRAFGMCVLIRCYNPFVDREKRLGQLKPEFLRRLQDLPHDISVPKYERWDGPGPIPMADYVVEYEADAESILRRVLSADQVLGLLRHRLGFRLKEQSRVLVVSLAAVAEVAAF